MISNSEIKPVGVFINAPALKLPEPYELVSAEAIRAYPALYTAVHEGGPCDAVVKPASSPLESCEECGHSMLLHPGIPNPGLSACLACVMIVQARVKCW